MHAWGICTPILFFGATASRFTPAASFQASALLDDWRILPPPRGNSGQFVRVSLLNSAEILVQPIEDGLN